MYTDKIDDFRIGNRVVNNPNQIFQFFEQIKNNPIKQQVELEVTYVLEKGFDYLISSIELRMGDERLYVVKNIKQLLQSILDNRIIEFGKKFVFDPRVHCFDINDQEIIDLLIEAYEHEKMLQDEFRGIYYQTKSIFKAKKAYLSSPMLKRLFANLENTEIKTIIFGEKKEDVMIIQKDLPLKFELTQKDGNLLLDLENKHRILPLTDDGEYCLYEDRIYKLSKDQRQYFGPFYRQYVDNLGRGIAFSNNQKERFVSEILPYVKRIADISIDKKVSENIYQHDLLSKIYFDQFGNGISARIEFHYGDRIVNPFQGQREISQSDKILVREVEKERHILDMFEQAEFKVTQGKIYLQDEQRIFKFIYDILPKLDGLAEIYYSEEFKNIKIHESRKFASRIYLDENSNMLEISFEYEDISPEELAKIISSVQKKKKYYRLKDGSFMPLETPELEQWGNILLDLEISEKDLKNKTIQIPQYRAMYIESQLNDSNLHHIKRNSEFKNLVKNIRQPKDMVFDIPDSLQEILRDYQKTGYKWLKTLNAYGMGGILADDMGLGKTLQVIAFILSQKTPESKPAIIIAPTSLLYNWKEEVEKFTPEMNALIISGMPQERQEQLKEIQDANMVITSYPLIRRDIDLYEQIDFDYCFLDEAQHIKNPNTINAQSVKRIRAKRYFALTGTPIENSLMELWSIFDFIMPGYLFTQTKFSKKYENPIIKNKDQKALEKLSRHIRPFVLRRMKKDVLKELPEKIESKMTAEMMPEQKKLYLAYLQEARREVSKEIAINGFQKSQIKILALLTRLRQLCCHPALFIENYGGDSGKMVLLQQILDDAVSSGHRILLFSQFTSMLGIIGRHLQRENIDFFYLDGSTKAQERGEMVKRFNQGHREVFLISLKAGGTGLNLTGADMVIHFDPWWNPAVEEQATDRAYRIGQENVVQVMKLISQGTIEEKIYELQKKKKQIINSVIQSGETMLSKMTQEEIQGLFEI